MKTVQKTFPIDFQWPTIDPFLFCVHHYDHYPKGNGYWGPDESLAGRDLGQDFQLKNGYRMYHGETIPGFPVHPHRGFETITIVRQGLVDHADSLGAAGRYGNGDVQWMTAGSGIQHSEMFPLLHSDRENTLELFQIWINLPQSRKMVSPHFKMFWNHQIPVIQKAGVKLTLIAGTHDGQRAIAPPPDSWAASEENQVQIWLVKMDKAAEFTVPEAPGTNRVIYLFEGDSFDINGDSLSGGTGVHLSGAHESVIQSSAGAAEFLLLQGRPISEPVVKHGPFVMNTKEEIMQAMMDYQKTRFGGWPWQRMDMVHGSGFDRFALYPDGKRETPES